MSSYRKKGNTQRRFIQIDAHLWAKSHGETCRQRFILRCLADFSNDSFLCYPSIRTLAKVSLSSKVTVMKIIKELENLGLIAIERGDRKVNHYRLIGVEEWNETVLKGIKTVSVTLPDDPQTVSVTLPKVTRPSLSNKEREVKETPPRKKTPKKITLREYLDNCDLLKVDPLPGKSSIFEWASTVGIPESYIYIAWYGFCEQFYDDDEKFYSRWLMAFGKYVKNDYLQYWRVNYETKEYYLTTAGLAAQKIMESQQ